VFAPPALPFAIRAHRASQPGYRDMPDTHEAGVTCLTRESRRRTLLGLRPGVLWLAASPFTIKCARLLDKLGALTARKAERAALFLEAKEFTDDMLDLVTLDIAVPVTRLDVAVDRVALEPVWDLMYCRSSIVLGFQPSYGGGYRNVRSGINASFVNSSLARHNLAGWPF